MILGKEVSRCEEALSELNFEILSKRREDNFMSDVFSAQFIRFLAAKTQLNKS